MVQWVVQDRNEHLAARVVKVVEDRACQLHEDDLVLNASRESGLLGLGTAFDHKESLELFQAFCVGRVHRELEGLA